MIDIVALSIIVVDFSLEFRVDTKGSNNYSCASTCTWAFIDLQMHTGVTFYT